MATRRTVGSLLPALSRAAVLDLSELGRSIAAGIDKSVRSARDEPAAVGAAASARLRGASRSLGCGARLAPRARAGRGCSQRLRSARSGARARRCARTAASPRVALARFVRQ